MNLSAYFDEAGDTTDSIFNTLNSCNIKSVILRNIDNRNIADIDANTSLHKDLRSRFRSYGISVVALSTNVGRAGLVIDNKVKLTMDLAKFYGARYIKYDIGVGDQKTFSNMVTELANRYNIIPVIEPTLDGGLPDLTSILEFLKLYQTWRVVYDPVNIILKNNCDVFVKYWTVLKNKVVAIDVRDHEIGGGHRLLGSGDAKIANTVADSDGKHLFLEPSLGRKYNGTKSDSFKNAFDSLVKILDDNQHKRNVAENQASRQNKR